MSLMEQTNPLPNQPTPPQIPVNPPANPPIQPLSPKKPRLIFLLAFLFMALVSLGAYGIFKFQTKPKTSISSPSTIQPSSTQPSTVIPSPSSPVDPTAGWKTYTNTKYNYSFKYPNDYQPPEESKNYLSLISPLNPNRGKDNGLQNGELKIEIVTETAKEDNSALKCWNDHNPDNIKPLKQSEISISGINTTIIDWENMGTGQFICLTHNGQRYLINKYPLETTRQSEFDQILSTFKFN